MHAKRDRGQTLVEFALILPIFILLLVGIFDMGRGVFAYNTINNAAREAVRVAIVNQTNSVIEAEAIKQAVTLNLTGTDVDVNFLQPDYSNAAPCNATPRTGCVVEVIVRYQYTAATPIIGNIVGVLDLEGSSRQPIERTFPAPP